MKITMTNFWTESKKALAWSGMAVTGFILASCATAPNVGAPESHSMEPLATPAVPAMGGAENVASAPVEARKRTGIATGWGREVGSPMTYTNFTRASSKPVHVSTIRYNDREGAKDMGVDLGTKSSTMQKTAGGNLEWGMESRWGGTDNYWWRGGRFVVGKKGREYQIKIRNLSNARVEAVLSVDGLDVIDGRPASTTKRGYIVNPKQTLVVKGFRTSHESVASFKFSSVGSSYANLRHSDTRNVGVVGLAVYYEKGALPGAEAARRGGARAFAKEPLIRARD